MIQILGKAASINVRKVLWACDELGLRYTREDWGAGFRPTSDPAFLALNPNAMVPVLRDGDFVLWESNTILRYLANRHGAHAPALYPAEPQARAHVDQWMDWQASDLNTAWRPAFMGLVRRHADFLDAAGIAASLAAWARYMQVLEGRLERTAAYVGGAAFTLADIPIGLSVTRWYRTLEVAGAAGAAAPALPAVRDYVTRLRARPGFRAHADNGEP
ncbi:MAG: glutathione S-transferase N-terminal domain-containing protein [Bordetella sp.]|nr:glutathione S-transferase N-terminal domain-containing protein [Bordetella sp.]